MCSTDNQAWPRSDEMRREADVNGTNAAFG